MCRIHMFDKNILIPTKICHPSLWWGEGQGGQRREKRRKKRRGRGASIREIFCSRPKKKCDQEKFFLARRALQASHQGRGVVFCYRLAALLRPSQTFGHYDSSNIEYDLAVFYLN